MLSQILYNTLVNYLLFNFIYYLTSGILFLIDFFELFPSKKIQDKKNYLDNYIKCLPCVMINTLVYAFLPCLIFGWYEFYFNPIFNILGCILDICVSIILTDIFFYGIHRVLHMPYFYKKYHKQHHEIITPIGLCAVYMTMVDFYVGNILPVLLPMLIIGAHITTIRIWLTIIIVNTIVFAHSGFMIAEHHDKHHTLFIKNYGIGIFMDKIFGTSHD